jgi:anti-sigma B factor antagonist
MTATTSHMTATTASVSSLEKGVTLIRVDGHLLGDEEITAFKNAVTACIAENRSKLLIDLGGVDYMNSTAIGVLVSAFTSYTRRHWQLKYCGINCAVNTILTITKLSLIFDIAEKRTDALAKFSG